MTRKELFQTLLSASAKLYDEHEAQAVAERMCECLYGFSRFEATLDPAVEVETPALAEQISRLESGEPVQYIIGWTEFRSRRMIVRPGVLIPRVETEELVGLIISENRCSQPHILDIGTGSGAIAVTLAAEIENAQVEALDISPAALAIAKANAEVHAPQVSFVEADIFSWEPSGDLYDVIVSNPPYIPLSERSAMHRNVVDYEPEGALFVPDESPLLFYSRIADVALGGLKEGGKLYFEVHELLSEETAALLSVKGFSDVVICRDLFSKPRMVVCTKRR